ncbi:hypothetical protein ACLOJK_030806 [Asimina triloba]
MLLRFVSGFYVTVGALFGIEDHSRVVVKRFKFFAGIPKISSFAETQTDLLNTLPRRCHFGVLEDRASSTKQYIQPRYGQRQFMLNGNHVMFSATAWGASSPFLPKGTSLPLGVPWQNSKGFHNSSYGILVKPKGEDGGGSKKTVMGKIFNGCDCKGMVELKDMIILNAYLDLTVVAFVFSNIICCIAHNTKANCVGLNMLLGAKSLFCGPIW